MKIPYSIMLLIFSIVSNRIEMKFDRIVLEANLHRLTELDFWCGIVLSKWQPRHYFTHYSGHPATATMSLHTEKCCYHLVSAYAVSVQHICSICQFHTSLFNQPIFPGLLNVMLGIQNWTSKKCCRRTLYRPDAFLSPNHSVKTLKKWRIKYHSI